MTLSETPSAAKNNAALSIRGVHKRFGGVVAVNGCTFDVPKGSITGLIGPNGAGKTTLFNVISGFLAPDEGQILLNGVDVAGERPHDLFRRGLVRTFQIPHEFSRMTVLENLMVVPKEQQGEKLLNTWLRWGAVQGQENGIRDRANEVLDVLRMTHVRNELAGGLSGGQKKLLELGRTMMAQHKVVLLDEPGAGVNPTLMRELAEHIVRFKTELGCSLCIIEHDMDLIGKLSDSVIVLTSEGVLAQGSMDEIRANDQVIEAYLGHTGVGAEPRPPKHDAEARRQEGGAGAQKADRRAPP